MTKRFIVENETCFVTLLTQGRSKVGLCIQGASQMEQFCQDAIQAYEELLYNKNKKKRLNGLLDDDEKT